MSELLSVLDALALTGRAATVPLRTLQDTVALIRTLEARERYLMSYGDPFSQRVVRGELDDTILSKTTTTRPVAAKGE